MTDALEEYIMKERANQVPKQPRDLLIKDYKLANAPLPDLYQHQCKQMALKPDPTVMRILENEKEEIWVLDLSTLVFSKSAFEAIMEICRLLPNLGILNLAHSNLKPHCIPALVDMAEEHPFLHSINLSHNPALGFSCAKLLLPLMKDNQRFIRLDVEGTGMAAPTQQLIQKVLIANRLYRQEQGEDLEALDRPPQKIPGSPMSLTKASELDASMRSIGGISTRFKGVNSGDIDAAIQKLNEELQVQVMENEERLVNHYSQLIATAAQQRTEVADQLSQTVKLQEQFLEGWKWPYTSQFQVADCIEDLQLVLTEDDLEDLRKLYNKGLRSAAHIVRPLLEELLEAGCTRRRKHAILKDVAQKVRHEGPGMSGHVEVTTAFSDLLTQDANTVEALKVMLRETEEQLEAMRGKMSRAEANRAEALQKEDLRGAEIHFETSLDVQEEMLDLVLYRLNTLLDKVSKASLIESLEKLKSQSREQVKESRDFNADVLDRIGKDTDTLKGAKADAQTKRDEQEAEYNKLQQQIETDLTENQTRQIYIWDSINNAFADLAELARDRVRTMEAWVQGVEGHEGAKVDYTQRMKVYDEHLETLRNLQRGCELSEETIKAFEDFADGAVRAGERLASKSSTDGDGMVKEEQKRYLELFRQFYLESGELLFKKQKQIEELDRMIRSCVFQIDFCKETLDPELVRYRDQLKDLNLMRVEVADKVNRLQIRGDARASQFLPHEEMMHRNGLEFESPLLEMCEDTVTSRARVLAQRQKFIKKDKEELVDKEAAGIDEMLQTTKAARAHGVHTLLQALSPAAPHSRGTPTRAAAPISPFQQRNR